MRCVARDGERARRRGRIERTYFPVAPGDYDLRAVTGSATDCATMVSRTARASLATLSPGEYRTLAVIGSAGKLFFRVLDLADDRAPGPTQVRFASTTLPSPALTLGVGMGESFVPWISEVPYASLGITPETDARGYAVVPPVSGATLTLRARAGAEQRDVLHSPNFELREGETVTFFASGYPGTGSTMKLVACFDDDDSRAPLGACSTTTYAMP